MPDFGSHAYWDARFARDGKPYDWLMPSTAIRDFALQCMESTNLRRSEILHIGCGTSDSSILRELVAEPRQIHNIDFSQVAIDAASLREKERTDKDGFDLLSTEGKHDSVHSPITSQKMLWSCLDLLSLNSTLALMEQQLEVGSLFDLVLDKSTSDSIACANAPALNLPYILSVNGWTRGIGQSGVSARAEVHPLHVLAVHLAALTKPRTGKWISISYSEDRFPFLPPYPQTVSHGLIPEGVVKAGFPHPSQLWRLEAKERIVKEETLADRKKRMSSGVVFRPEASHWVYVLVRTDTLVIY